jgi:hypothetical protein
MSQHNDKKKRQNTDREASMINRRTFVKGAAIGTAGLLVGASTVASTTTQSSTGTSEPMVKVSRPDIIRFYPDGLSKVVQTHHAGVWTGEPQVLNPDVLHQMLDVSITELTGLNNATEAWTALFSPDERVAIKVNTLFMKDCTHASLVMVVTECLQEAGIPAEQIIIFDRTTPGLRHAGYAVNTDGPGVRCYGTKYTEERTIADTSVRLSNILLECDALINMPILTGITFFGAGISFAMKNHFGTFDRPQNFHGSLFVSGLTELNALPPIKSRTRLIIGDILTAKPYRSAYGRYVIGQDKILMSFDPVAHDMVGAQLAEAAYTAEGRENSVVIDQATPWLKLASEMGLGTNALENIDLVEINLG